MRFPVNCAFSQGFGKVQQQGLCANIRRITGTVAYSYYDHDESLMMVSGFRAMVLGL